MQEESRDEDWVDEVRVMHSDSEKQALCVGKGEDGKSGLEMSLCWPAPTSSSVKCYRGRNVRTRNAPLQACLAHSRRSGCVSWPFPSPSNLDLGVTWTLAGCSWLAGFN